MSQTDEMRPLAPERQERFLKAAENLGYARARFRVLPIVSGQGEIRRIRSGLFEVLLPDELHFDSFCASLAERIAAAEREVVEESE